MHFFDDVITPSWLVDFWQINMTRALLTFEHVAAGS